MQGRPEAALRETCGAAPSFLLALLRVWTNAVPTGARRGWKVRECPVCGRGDRVGHLVGCARTWRIVQVATVVDAPPSVAAAIGLEPGPATAVRARGKFRPPLARAFALAVMIDAAAKAQEAQASGGRAAQCRRVFDTASRQTRRRLLPLCGAPILPA